MELTTLALYADIVQAIAVVTTLIFVGFQVRYSTRIARMSAAQTSAQLLTENLGRVTDNPEFAELISRSRENSTNLTDGERLRISNFMTAAFRHLEVLHAHQRYDIYEEELWQSAFARLRRMLASPRIQEWWIENKDVYAASFVIHVDEEIQKLIAAELTN